MRDSAFLRFEAAVKGRGLNHAQILKEIARIEDEESVLYIETGEDDDRRYDFIDLS